MKRWHIIITMPECKVSISQSNTKWNSSWRARASALRGIVFCWKVVFELRMFNDVTVLTVHLSFSTHIYNSMWVAGWAAGTLSVGRKGTSRIQIRHFRPTGRRRDFFFFFFCTLDGFNASCSLRDSVHFVDCLWRRTLLFPTWGRSTSRWGMVILYDKGFLYRWAPGTLESTDRIAGGEPRQADLCSYRIQILGDETLLTVLLRRLLASCALYLGIRGERCHADSWRGLSHVTCLLWLVCIVCGVKTCSPCDVEVKAVKPCERPTVLLDQGVVEAAEKLGNRTEIWTSWKSNFI